MNDVCDGKCLSQRSDGRWQTKQNTDEPGDGSPVGRPSTSPSSLFQSASNPEIPGLCFSFLPHVLMHFKWPIVWFVCVCVYPGCLYQQIRTGGSNGGGVVVEGVRRRRRVGGAPWTRGYIRPSPLAPLTLFARLLLGRCLFVFPLARKHLPFCSESQRCRDECWSRAPCFSGWCTWRTQGVSGRQSWGPPL